MFLGVEPTKCLLTEAGCWPFHFQLVNTPIYARARACEWVTETGWGSVQCAHLGWMSFCVCVHFSIILFPWPQDFQSDAYSRRGLTQRERERPAQRGLWVRDEIHPIPLLLLSQEVWRWHASTWRSRRASCVRRRCCWARPTRTSVLKLRSKPESWVRLRYFIIRDDQLGDAPWLVDKLYSIFYAHLQVAHNCKHQQF